LNLVIDIGNTLQKIAVFNNDDCAYYQSFTVITKEIITPIINQYPIKYSIISSVAAVDIQVIDCLKANTTLIHYSQQTKLPIKILYKSENSLGLDRVANAVGATVMFPNRNVLSIQTGTCLVFDFVNEKSEYLGGSISPGIKMRFEALHKSTKNLPELHYSSFSSPKQPLPNILGIDTNTSLSSGVINGICYEIEGFIAEYQTKFNDLVVIITGGDADFLRESIKNTIFAAPNLVMKGLHEIIKYNV
jgi:type III pantothenate kinase